MRFSIVVFIIFSFVLATGRRAGHQVAHQVAEPEVTVVQTPIAEPEVTLVQTEFHMNRVDRGDVYKVGVRIVWIPDVSIFVVFFCAPVIFFIFCQGDCRVRWIYLGIKLRYLRAQRRGLQGPYGRRLPYF